MRIKICFSCRERYDAEEGYNIKRLDEEHKPIHLCNKCGEEVIKQVIDGKIFN